MGTDSAVVRHKLDVHISLDATALAKLDEQARRAGLSRSGLIQHMIDEWAEEDADMALASEAMRRLSDPHEARIQWEQMKRELAL
jgi:predicted DNA-binding protein